MLGGEGFFEKVRMVRGFGDDWFLIRHENCRRHGRRACGTIFPQVRNQNVQIPRIAVTNSISNKIKQEDEL